MATENCSALIAGCGYLGFRAAKAWIAKGRRVTAFTRNETRANEFMQAGLDPLLLDLAAPASEIQITPVDTVLWAVGFDRSASASREQVWLDGLRWLVQNLSNSPRRFIYVSSTSVYGEVEGEVVDEFTSPKPNTEGGECCLNAERLLRSECAKLHPETEVVVLRMAGIYGPDRLLRRIDDLRNQVPLSGEPDHWLNLIHVDDAVSAVKQVALADTVPQVINVVNSGTINREQYYARLAQLASAHAPVFGSTSSTGRQRGGNKRVTSRFAEHKTTFQFDDVLEGLEDAYRRTSEPR